MAKKKIQPRRVPRAAEPRMYGDGKPSAQATERPAATNGAAAVRSAATRPAPAAGRTPVAPVRPPVTVTTDYTYVMKDLRRLGMLSAGVFAVLVALGLILR